MQCFPSERFLAYLDAVVHALLVLSYANLP